MGVAEGSRGTLKDPAIDWHSPLDESTTCTVQRFCSVHIGWPWFAIEQRYATRYPTCLPPSIDSPVYKTTDRSQ